jgi:hypothetical protein
MSDDEEHAFLFLADPQAQTEAEMQQFRDETVPDVRETVKALGDRPVFGVGGGDLVFDDAAHGGPLVEPREREVEGTAVDFSSEALTTAEQWAKQLDVSLHTFTADVRDWTPSRQWDAVVVTFLQLLPAERSALYRTMQSCLRPGGLAIGEWFRPVHLDGDYDRIGPSRPDRMVSVEEVRTAFSEDDLLQCEAVDVELDEGPFLNGSAAVTRLLARRRDERQRRERGRQGD